MDKPDNSHNRGLKQAVISKNTQKRLGTLPAGYPHRKMKQEGTAGKYGFSHLLEIKIGQPEASDEVRVTPEKREVDKKQIRSRSCEASRSYLMANTDQ